MKDLSLGAAAVIAAPSFLSHATEPDLRPNILLIMVDDLGFGDLSSFGATDLRTPHIDALVHAGMRFSHFYANCPVCSPTRAALLTGRYPDLVGVPGVIRTHSNNSWGYLDPNATLLPQVLRNAGYNTAVIGKWHLGLTSPNVPTPDRGVDYFKGFLGDMMDDYYTHLRHGFNYMREDEREIQPEGHATDLFAQWAMDYIKSRKQHEPFFLYLAFNAPHTPIQPPQAWYDKVLEREKTIDPKRAKLVALIEHLDDAIGKVIRALNESGLAQNTLIIFTSDNGGQLDVGGNNGHLRGGKQDMTEGGIRVPTCFVWPDQIMPGTESSRVTLTMDIFPTICEAVKISQRDLVDGSSFFKTLRGEVEQEPDRFLFWVRLEGGKYRGIPYYAVRKGKWKVLQNSPNEDFELYDLEQYPLESHPLDHTHEQRRVLLKALQEHIAAAARIPWRPPEFR